jgi:PAS domain S-box-containing protein
MTPIKVLIVEDENIIALDLKRILTRAGYAVTGVANSGLEAFAAVAATPPEAILMDIGLSGDLDGIQTSQRILETLDVPIIFVTANSDLATVQKSQNANPFGYILKPFDEREISIVLQMALFKHKTDREVRESRQWLAATLRSISEGVIATTSTGEIKFMNLMAERLTGWKEAEAIGKPLIAVFNLINRQTRQTVEDPVARALRSKQAISFVNLTALTQKGGQEVAVDTFASPIINEKGAVEGVVLTFRQVSTKPQTNPHAS